MKKLLIILTIVFSIPAFSQKFDFRLEELERHKAEYKWSAWSALSLSVFSYSVGAAGFVNPWSDPQTRSHVFLMGTIGLSFNTLAITKFVMMRRIQRQIDKYKFDNYPFSLERYKPIDSQY